MAEIPKVRIGDIIDQLHAKYAKQLTQMIQENAEAQASIDALLARVDELETKLAALTRGFDD